MIPIRMGLLGAARIAPNAVIKPAAKRDDVAITAVAARDPARAAAFAKEHGIADVAADYDALIHRDDVDIVYVALPVSAHAEWTIKALEAGKAVLCEKSFSSNADEAKAMVAAGERAGRPLIEAYHYRLHRVMRRAVEIVASGELGAIRRAEAMFDAPIKYDPNEIRWRADQGGGALGDLGCYPLHAVRSLIGAEPEIVAAQIRMEHGVDAETAADLRFPGGATGRISCSMTAGRFAASLSVEGDKGRMDIVNYLAPQIGCQFTVAVGGVERSEPTDGPTTYEAQMEHVVEVMAGRAEPILGGADAIAQMTAIDAIKAAA
jgi:predicted dehydrogenase